MIAQTLVFALALLPLVAANCNIDEASVTRYSTGDLQVVSKAGMVITFRLGCSHGSKVPLLHAETDDGQYLAVSSSNLNKELRQVSFVDEVAKAKSRWSEIRVYDETTYQKLVHARQSGSSESGYTPMKTFSRISFSISTGPYFKMETVATLSLIVAFFFAHTLRSKIVN